MSTTYEMPSSGSIVVVENTGAVEHNANIIQQHQQHYQHQQQQQQHHNHQIQQHIQQHGQQIIVNEEFINAENLVAGGGGSVNYITNELIQNAQIIKIVSEEEAALIEQQQQQNPHAEQDQIYGTISTQQQLQNVQSANPNAKVHVISNVTIVSKAQQHQTPHTISFVNSKQSGTPGNYVNTYITKQTLSQSGKMVNIPFKTTNSNQLTQQQPQQILTKHISGTVQQQQQIMQKMTVPRIVTRVPQQQQQQQQQHQQQQQQQLHHNNVVRQNSNVGLAPPINSVIQTHQVQKQHTIQTVPIMNSAGTVIGGATAKVNNVRKSNAMGSSAVKLMHGNTKTSGVGMKSVPSQQHPKNQTTKNSKIIKHYNTNATPSSSMYISQQQHQQQQQQLHNKNVQHVQQQNTINNNNLMNNNNINNSNSKMLQQQRSMSSVNSIYIQGAVQKVGGKNSKYLLQQNQLSHIVLPTNQQQPQHVKITSQQQQQQQQQQHQQQYQQQIQQQQIISHNTGGSGTIKYVNAQGTVVAPPGSRVRTHILQQTLSPSVTHQQLYTSSADNLDHLSNTTNNVNSIDDMMIVNGTHMSDEVSARILQSLSQKSVFNNNRQLNQSQQQNPQYVKQQIFLATPSQTEYQLTTPVQQQQHHLSHQHHPIVQAASQLHHQNQHHPPHYRRTTANIGNLSEQQNKYGPEIFRVNTSDIHSPTTTFIDNIPLISSRTDNSNTYPTQNDQEDEVIGEEIRPPPVDTRLQTLAAIYQDHTYAHPPPRYTAAPVPLPVPPPPPPIVEVLTTPITINVLTASNLSVLDKQQQQQQQPQQLLSNKTNSVANSLIVNKLATTAAAEKDDDAHSVISTGSRNAGNNLDIDLGEETETAAEGEGEDDSVTRCICDLTHDDGYMICCDKCSAWQHVDCMGIDRLNIPDEYKCELCQPRPVDRVRARALQLMKRKEQQNLILQQQQAAQHLQQPLPIEGASAAALLQLSAGIGAHQNQLHSNNFATSTTGTKKNRPLGGATTTKRKNDLPPSKRKRTESATRANGKKREPKKISKRKAKQQTDLIDKQAANLRTWIENYEFAMTNHYSPELRARLHAIGKQQHNSQSASIPSLKHTTSLDGKCTTVPHAGGKILISTLDITPSHAVIEIRGKYMLSGQYKQQQAIPPTNKNQIYSRNPGPFIFFYRLPNDGPEICVDTRTYGNEARFVRRSCRPNSEILHTIEKGTIHLYIVSLSNVKSSTEITIKHEPHDLAAVQRGSISSPTSTMCACGLTKDCLFSTASIPVTPTPSTPTTISQPPPLQSTTAKLTRLNGNVNQDDSVTSTIPQIDISAALPPQLPRKTPTIKSKAAYKRKQQQQQQQTAETTRGRSTSSSGDSNTGLLSPSNNSNGSSTTATASVSSLIHDSGICTSSSSPPISMPSPSRPTQLIQIPQQSPQQIVQFPQQINVLALQPQQHPIDLQFIEHPQVQQSQQPLQVQQPQLVQQPMQVQQIQQQPHLQQIQQHVQPQPQSIHIQSAQQPEETQATFEQPNAILLLTHPAPPPAPLPSPQPIQIIQNVDANQKITQAKIVKQPSPQKQPQLQQEPQQPQEQLQQQQVIRPTTLNLENVPPVITSPPLIIIGQNQITPVPQLHSPPIQPPTQIKSPTPTPTSNVHQQPSQKSQSGRKTPRKSSCSLSEDSSSMADDHHQPQTQQPQITPQQPKKEKETKVSKSASSSADTKKLTREERKMQAIVRAFEKMERNQQRKQELKQSKSTTPTTPTSASCGASSTTPTTPSTGQSASMLQKRRSSISPNGKRFKSNDEDDFSSPSKKSSPQMRKKKRKGARSYQHMNLQRKRLRTRLNSGDSDNQHTVDVSPRPYHMRHSSIATLNDRQQQSLKFKQDGAMKPLPTFMSTTSDKQESDVVDGILTNDVGSAAGVLMALSSHCKIDETESQQLLKSPTRIRRSLSEQTTPPFPLSSACMLVEAAVGPLERTNTLENEFKMPPKTKTKKTIMNDWLHQSDANSTAHQYISSIPQQQPLPDEEQHSQMYNLDTLSHVVASNVNEYQQSNQVPYQEEPQNLSMAAKRVEEFINITSQDGGGGGGADTDDKWSNSTTTSTFPNVVSADVPQLVPPSLPTPPMLCGSSVKKRWLRQAISEECSDDVISPPNGYMTPLKKRRMARECQDLMRQQQQIQQQQIVDSLNGIQKIISNNYLSPPSAESADLQNDVNKTNLIVETDNKAAPDVCANIKYDDSSDTTKNEASANTKDEFVKSEVDNVNLPESAKTVVENVQVIKAEIKPPPLENSEVKIEMKNEPPLKHEDAPADVVMKNENKMMKNEDSELKSSSPPHLEDAKVKAKIEVMKEEKVKIKNIQLVEDVKNENILQPAEEKCSSFEVTTDGDAKIEAECFEKTKSEVFLNKNEGDELESDIRKDEPQQAEQTNVEKPVVNMVSIQTEERMPLVEDEFDIKPLNEVEADANWSVESSPTDEKKSAESTPPPPPTTIPLLINNDEIADIQKRLHSFHNENLMILQIRNKKKMSRATTPSGFGGDDDCGDSENSCSPQKRTKQLCDDLPDAAVDKVADENETINEDAWKLKQQLLPNYPMDAPQSFSQTYSSYLNSHHTTPTPVPAPTPQLSVTNPTLPFLYNTFSNELAPPEVVSQLPPTVVGATKSLLSEYLENPNKSSSFTSLGFVSMLDQQPRQHSMYSVNAPVPPPILGSTSFLMKSYSTGSVAADLQSLSSLSTTTAATTILSSSLLNNNPGGTTVPSSTSATIPTPPTAPPKIFTRTQSADPRLNPNLTTPEPVPAPKRKLSINEYRKRKQLFTDHHQHSDKQSRKHSSPTASQQQQQHALSACSDSNHLDDGPLDNGVSSSLSHNEKNTVFNSAPTLLELQQESLSQRLKSYKSFNELTAACTVAAKNTTSMFNSCDDKDDEVESIMNRYTSTKSLMSNNSSVASSISSTPDINHCMTTTITTATTASPSPIQRSQSSSFGSLTSLRDETVTDPNNSFTWAGDKHELSKENSSPSENTSR